MRKKTGLLVIAAVVLTFGLSGCGTSKDTSQAAEGKTDTEISQEAETETDAETGDAAEVDMETSQAVKTDQLPDKVTETVTIDELGAWFTNVQDTLAPGSAGCSLRAAALGGKLLDWYAQSDITEEEIKAGAADYIQGVSEEDMPDVEEGMYEMYNTIMDLSSGNDDGMLESAGYEKTQEWSTQDAQTLMDNIYAGLGFEMPQGESNE